MILNQCIKKILVPPIIIGFIIVSGILTAEAGLLKDIRIGEYEGFTRIVFELDTAGRSPNIQSQSNGRLSVSFDNTRPNLIRKIPVERSQHVKELKIFHRDNRLFLIFQIDVEHFRSETFPLENPPRIALDIHPQAARPVLPAEQETATGTSIDAKPEAPPGQLSANYAESEIVSNRSKSEKINREKSKTVPGQKPMAPSDEPKSETRLPKLIKSATDNSAAAPTMAETETSISHTEKKTNRLQFYLVIILVVITIVILALLLLMLLSRHQWTNDKDVPDVNEYLKHQDKRIASLNARIQEQLKRYEEA